MQQGFELRFLLVSCCRQLELSLSKLDRLSFTSPELSFASLLLIDRQFAMQQYCTNRNSSLTLPSLVVSQKSAHTLLFVAI